MISISWHFVKRDVVHSCCLSKRATTRNTDARQTQWWSLSMPGKGRERESVQTCARVLQYSLAHSRARVRVHTYFAWRSRTVDVQNNRHLSSLSLCFFLMRRARERNLPFGHARYFLAKNRFASMSTPVRARIFVRIEYKRECVRVREHALDHEGMIFFGFDVCEKENGSGQSFLNCTKTLIVHETKRSGEKRCRLVRLQQRSTLLHNL